MFLPFGFALTLLKKLNFRPDSIRNPLQGLDKEFNAF